MVATPKGGNQQRTQRATDKVRYHIYGVDAVARLAIKREDDSLVGDVRGLYAHIQYDNADDEPDNAMPREHEQYEGYDNEQ